MERIAVLTSGGDAPGMNAAIRAVTRTALSKGWNVMGARRGYTGLIEGDLCPLGARDVGGIMQFGGTVLDSSRSAEFCTLEGRRKALEQLSYRGVEGLVVIGGNGSQAGAHALWKMGFPVVGVASTIDNDLYGSDITIGVDTALNVALEAIDRLKVTASSLKRAFLVEVMGRGCGYLALMAGLAGGAEAIVIPEMEIQPEAVAAIIESAYRRGKKHAIIVVAEGAHHNADAMYEHIHERRDELGFDLRITRLGHVQRGGAPGASDRLLGTWLGANAVEAMARGEFGVLVGQINGQVATTPLDEVVACKKGFDLRLLELAGILDR